MKAKQSYIFLAPGVEEIEAMATIDALRRADIPVVAVAVDTTLQIKGATGQTIVADSLISEIDISDADWLIVPGGVPGAPNLHASKTVNDMLLEHFGKGGAHRLDLRRTGGSARPVRDSERGKSHMLPRPGRPDHRQRR